MRNKIKALQKFLNLNNKDEVRRLIKEEKYLVLTNIEANKACKENIVNTLWAFNYDFIEKYTNLKSTIENY